MIQQATERGHCAPARGSSTGCAPAHYAGRARAEAIFDRGNHEDPQQTAAGWADRGREPRDHRRRRRRKTHRIQRTAHKSLLIGYITAAVVPFPCEGGEVAILNGIEPVHTGTVSPNRLPWHIRFDSFTGVLPRITGIRIQIIDASILLWNAFAGCLYRSTSVKPLYAILEIVEGRIVDMRWEEAFNIPLTVTLFGFCPAGGRLSERSESLEIQGMTARVFVRPVQ
jgi:hypothetical protein